MNQEKFIGELMSLYPDLNKGMMKAYKAILGEHRNVNYAKLYKDFIHGYKYRNSPAPGILVDFLKDATTDYEKENAIERDLKSGMSKIIDHNETTTRTLVQREGTEYVYEFFETLDN